MLSTMSSSKSVADLEGGGGRAALPFFPPNTLSNVSKTQDFIPKITNFFATCEGCPCTPLFEISRSATVVVFQFEI
jgi:hypothetical protein